MKKIKPAEVGTLRQKAEEMLKNKLSKTGLPLSEADTVNLIRELLVHQIELEMQNEELIRAKEQAIFNSEKYIELYDFAPTGYFTLSPGGEIIQLNISGAAMLGIDRAQLKNSLFHHFVSTGDKPVFTQFLEKIFGSNAGESCELALETGANRQMFVCLTGMVSGNDGNCFVFATDIAGQKKIEESLLASEKKYHAIFNNVQDVFYQTDLSGTVLEVSPSIEKFSGFTRDEIIGKPIAKLYFDFKDRDMFLYKLKENGELIDYELRLKTKTRELRFVSINARFIFDDDGIPNHINGAIRDITERKRIQRLLDKNNKRYEELVNSISDIFFSMDQNLRFTFWNKASEKLAGLWYEDVIGKTLMEVFPDNAAFQRVKEMFQEVVKYKKPKRLVVKYPGNEQLIYDITVYPNAEGISVFVKDITEQKRAEESLVKLKTAVEKLEVSVVITDSNGNTEYANPFFTMLTGYSAEEYLGRSSNILKSGYHPKGFYEEMWNTINSGNTWEGEFYNRKKNGEYYWENAIISPVENNKKEITHFVAVKTDITESKKINFELIEAKAEAEQANLAKSEFLSRMSHELRTPLNSILGFAQLMDMGELAPSHKKGVHQIMKSGKHLLDLINEVLDLSRIEAGKLFISLEPVQHSGIIHETLDVVSQLAAGRNVSLEFPEPDFKDLYVKADRQKLKQVLLNLINNAVKYNSEGGSVTIKCSRFPASPVGGQVSNSMLNSVAGCKPETLNLKPETIRISVVDTGTGIAPEELHRLFTPFQRIGSEISEVEGTGLGLAIAKKLMEAMGGEIGVESKVGIGSTFWIELPQAEGQFERNGRLNHLTKPEDEKSVVGGTLLYIEDNISNIQLVEQILELHRPSIHLITEMYGKNAVKLATDYKPDFILLDLDLPDIHGSEVIKRLQANNETKSIPMVILTADAMGSSVKKLMKAGVKNYLTKPLDVTELLKIIDSMMEK